MKKIVILLLIVSSLLYADANANMSSFYDDELEINYNEGYILGFQSTNLFFNGVYLENHHKKQNYGGALLINSFELLVLELFYNYNIYNKKGYSQGGFYLDLNSLVVFDKFNISLHTGGGVFYSIEVGADKKWIVEIAVGTSFLIAYQKPDPNFKFNVKLGYLF